MAPRKTCGRKKFAAKTPKAMPVMTRASRRSQTYGEAGLSPRRDVIEVTPKSTPQDKGPPHYIKEEELESPPQDQQPRQDDNSIEEDGDNSDNSSKNAKSNDLSKRKCQRKGCGTMFKDGLLHPYCPLHNACSRQLQYSIAACDRCSAAFSLVREESRPRQERLKVCGYLVAWAFKFRPYWRWKASAYFFSEDEKRELFGLHSALGGTHHRFRKRLDSTTPAAPTDYSSTPLAAAENEVKDGTANTKSGAAEMETLEGGFYLANVTPELVEKIKKLNPENPNWVETFEVLVYFLHRFLTNPRYPDPRLALRELVARMNRHRAARG